MSVKPVLLFAYGNQSRGDDALAPLLLESIKQQGITQVAGNPVKYLTDFQMQIEHVTDLQGCERVLLMDAHKSLDRAFDFNPVSQRAESSYTTHGMSPETLLSTYQKVFQKPAPATFMLAIQGLSFELGDSLSDQAQRNLLRAKNFIIPVLQQQDFRLWDKNLNSVVNGA